MGGATRTVTTAAGALVGGAPGAAAGFLGSGGQLGAAGGVLDPADILGQRRKQQQEEQQKRAEAAAAKRRQEIEELFAGAPQGIQRTAGIQAQQIASNEFLTRGLSRAESDVNRLRAFGLTQGPTEQAQFLTEQQRLGEATQLEQLSEAQAQQQAQAFEGLAQRGGAGAGARERLGAAGAAGALREAQRTRRAGAGQRLGILSEDEARKLAVQGALPGQQVGVVAEKRAGLTADQQAALSAAQSTQRARAAENLANLRQQQALFQTRAGLLGGGQLAEQQRAAAAQQQQIGPLGSSGGFLGLPALGNLFGG